MYPGSDEGKTHKAKMLFKGPKSINMEVVTCELGTLGFISLAPPIHLGIFVSPANSLNKRSSFLQLHVILGNHILSEPLCTCQNSCLRLGTSCLCWLLY